MRGGLLATGYWRRAIRKRLLATGYWLLARREERLRPRAIRARCDSGQQPVASRQWPRAARGFSLVAALFLIVVVAALGAFAMRIGAGQQQTVNLALLSAKALAAANSGIEYGAYQALSGSGCANTALNLNEGGLTGFTVNVTCASTSHSEAGSTVLVYRIDATSTFGTYGMPDYVSRHVFATFASVP